MSRSPKHGREDDSVNGASKRLTRRAFARGAAAAAGLAICAPLSAEENPVTPAKELDGFEAALALVILNAPHLPASDREDLEAQVRSTLESQKSLRALDVPDGTEPDFVFRATEAGR
ncbi:MAG TPA: hypothetical protein VGM37_09545 [Armatimonadota bacterium]|jgi:hypothetical protein